MCQTQFLCRSNYRLPALLFPRALSRKRHELTWIAKCCFHRFSGSKILITSTPSIHLILRVLNECMRYFLASQRNTHGWFWGLERPLLPLSSDWWKLPGWPLGRTPCPRSSQSVGAPCHLPADLCPAGRSVMLWSKLRSYSRASGITTTPLCIARGLMLLKACSPM